jgi:hypothetical protein
MLMGIVAASLALPLSGPAGAAKPCTHLLVDPSGDVDTSTAMLIPPAEVDLLSADLRTTRSEVVAAIRIVDLPDEATELVDYYYAVDFTTNDERYSLTFIGAKPNNDAWAWHVIAGDDHPEQGGGASASEGVGAATRFTVDRRHNVVTLRFSRAMFDEFGGIGRKITDISASAWWGNGVKPTPESGLAGSYASSDFGYTRRVYTDGGASCA